MGVGEVARTWLRSFAGFPLSQGVERTFVLHEKW